MINDQVKVSKCAICQVATVFCSKKRYVLKILSKKNLKTLSRNKILISIKGHNSVTNKQKITGKSPNLDTFIQNLVKFYQIVLQILSGNEIMT